MAKRMIRLARSGIVDANNEFDWNDALIDAGIAAGVTFFATLTGIGIAGLFDDPTRAVAASLIAAGGAFFAWLAMKRNIKARK